MTENAVQAYADALLHATAALPIIDYHNHLPWRDILDDRSYDNLAQLWLVSDPYKHRLMRIKGIPERLITGDSSDWEKFRAFCMVFPMLIGTPVYEWARMELRTVFGCTLLPSADTASEIWAHTQAQLRTPAFSARAIVKRFRVEYLAPCCRITEDVARFAESDLLAPSLRGDDWIAPTPAFLAELEASTGRSTDTLDAFTDAAAARMDVFHQMGCRFADHALDSGFRYAPDARTAAAAYAKLRDGRPLTDGEQRALSGELLRRAGVLYARRGWAVQLHVGAVRATSDRLRAAAGAAGGYAAIGTDYRVEDLTRLLNDWERAAGGLPKVILYTLNPAYNAAFAALSGSYARDGVPGVVCQGPAWWWCDHRQGIRQMLSHYASYAVLSEFVGMTTDSRSLLSLTRHAYFRQIACQWLAEKCVSGEYDCTDETAQQLLTDIFYRNARLLLPAVRDGEQ